MKVKDLLEMEIDVDVVDNVCEELNIGFCGPVELTDEGKQKFADVLEFDISLDDDCVNVDVDDYDEAVFERKLAAAQRFFLNCAGWCSEEDWNKWFV